jgi:hypothetical protein
MIYQLLLRVTLHSVVHYEKRPPWDAEVVRAHQDNTPFQMQWPVGGGSAETKETECKARNCRDGGAENGGWREEVQQGRVRWEAEGRCMSPERKEIARSHKPSRLGHQPGNHPEQGWYKGHRQQICLHSQVLWVPS